jgi:hypothetical protein
MHGITPSPSSVTDTPQLPATSRPSELHVIANMFPYCPETSPVQGGWMISTKSRFSLKLDTGALSEWLVEGLNMSLPHCNQIKKAAEIERIERERQT